MPRKPDVNKKERYNDPFPTRLRKLIEDHGTKQDDLRAVLNLKNRQSVTGYIDGETLPTIDKLIDIARYYHVSADYLLGLSPVVTEDRDVRFVCDYTGLNEKTIDKFHKYAHLRNHESKILEVFDGLISLFYEQIIIKLFLIKNSVEKGKQYLSLTEPDPGRSSVIFGPLRMLLYSFSEFCRRIPNELFGSDEVFDNLEKQSWIYITEKEIGLDEFLENSEEDLN